MLHRASGIAIASISAIASLRRARDFLHTPTPPDPTDPELTDPTRQRLADPTRPRGWGVALEGAGTPLAAGPPAARADPFLTKIKILNCNSNVQHANSNPPLPHDVLHHTSPTDTYNWRLDAYHCYLLAIRLMALRAGSIQPATPAELYWAEAHGVVP